ncbi:MAG: glycosyltransferase family 39 protein [Planctomycetes bacterium]|nr:glycosyltransferase family 39 protein [Planctomycetota bacterium]
MNLDAIKPKTQALVLAALTAAAFGLRVRHLGTQILGGDELHVLKVISAHSFSEIFGLVKNTDFSIPLTLFYKGIASWSPLSEWSLRIPVLAVGSLVPALLVWGVRGILPFRVALLLGIVAASHPFFIFYSRYVRPYGICLFLLFLALVCLDRWQRGGKKGVLISASVLCALAAWFNLGSLVTAACLFAGALLRALLFKQESTEHQDVKKSRLLFGCLLAGIITLGLALLLYCPALAGIQENILAGKLGKGTITAEALWRNAAVLTGYPGKAGALLFLCFSILGAISLILKKRSFAAFILVPALGQPLLIFLLNPYLVDFSLVLARYLFNVLPMGLLLACVGVDALISSLAAAFKPLLPAAGILGCGLWLCLGPYNEIYEADHVFTAHNAYQTYVYRESPFWIAAGHHDPATRLPPFYRNVREETLLLEGPAPEGFFNNMIAFYQHYHGRPVKLITTEDLFWGDPAFALDNVIVLRDGEELSLEQGALALVHKNALREISDFLHHKPSSSAQRVYSPKATQALIALLQNRYGPPIHEDDYLSVFRIPPSKR